MAKRSRKHKPADKARMDSKAQTAAFKQRMLTGRHKNGRYVVITNP